MVDFVGCKEAKEISMTRDPANELAIALVTKKKSTATPEQVLETTDMDEAAIQKAAAAIATKMLAFDDVTKSHYLSLNEDAQAAFLAKTSDEQKAEATAAKTKADDEAAAAELAKSGKSAVEAALQKSLDDTNKELAEIRKERAAEKADAEIEKRARDEFSGYPGGPDKVVPLLKAYAGLSEDARVASEAVLKSQCAIAKRGGTVVGFRSEEDIAKAQPVTAKIEKAAKERAQKDGVTYHEAYSAMSREPAWQEDFAVAQDEEEAA